MHLCFGPSCIVKWTSKNRRPRDQGFLIYALLCGKHRGYLNGPFVPQLPTLSPFPPSNISVMATAVASSFQSTESTALTKEQGASHGLANGSASGFHHNSDTATIDPHARESAHTFTNGGSPQAVVNKVPAGGVWAPAVTWFDQNTDDLSLQPQAQYYSYLSKSGLAGLVVLGTNAETFLLTQSERKTLVVTARQACGPSFPIMAGVGGHSTKQVLEYIKDAADAGANYALLLPPAYFGKQTTPAVINNFFDEVAERSCLPIVIYNFPNVVNGIDLDSATLVRLAKRHSNIVGVKLTCGAVAKITRLSAELPADQFSIYGGQSDFLIGGLASGAAGTIAGFANVFPKTIVRIFDLYQEGRMKEAMALHQKAALAEQGCKAGIATVKYAVAQVTAKAAGIDESLAKQQLKPRRPYQEPSDEEMRSIDELIAPLLEIEAGL
jgi:4-hydroxy-2-oxoglutarate aldolase